MRRTSSARCRFETRRLRVGPWHDIADELRVDLAESVAGMLTVDSTTALPEAWRGDYSIERAAEWIEDRDAESSVLLVVGSTDEQPVGVAILAELPLEDASVELRIGFLLAENVWGHGLATELLSGLVGWARNESEISTIAGGVESTNRASARALEKSGFRLVGEEPDGTMTYRLDTSPD